MHQAPTLSPPTDFDFVIGSWDVRHRRLKERLVACTDWVEFQGISSTRKVLGGFGNLEDNYLELPGDGYAAVALRSFSSQTGQWSIWWLDGRHSGSIEPPVVGRFEAGVGVFFADDFLNGQPIKVRLSWSVPKPDLPHWEQAFSADAGKTWETNWIMDFTRRAD